MIFCIYSFSCCRAVMFTSIVVWKKCRKELKENVNWTYKALFEVIDLIVENFVVSMNSNFAVDKSVYSLRHFIKVLRVELFKVLHQNLRCRRLPNKLFLITRLLLVLELLLSLSRHIPTHCSSHAPTHDVRRLLRLNLLLTPCGLSHRLLLDHLRIRSGGLH